MTVRPRLLYVEDHADTRRALTRLLSGGGVDIQTAATVAEAVARLAWQPDALLLDLMLPDGSGLSVAMEARRRGMAVPIAMFTAAFQPPVDEGAQLAVTWLAKGDDLGLLLGWVDEVVLAATGAIPQGDRARERPE